MTKQTFDENEYVLLPKEPTQRMLTAAGISENIPGTMVYRIYKAMLDAEKLDPGSVPKAGTSGAIQDKYTTKSGFEQAIDEYLSAAPKPADTQVQDGDYTAWLLEKEENGQILYLRYYPYSEESEYEGGCFNFTPSADEALHFGRRIDAERVGNECPDTLRIVQHMWPDVSALTTAQAAPDMGWRPIHGTSIEGMAAIYDCHMSEYAGGVVKYPHRAAAQLAAMKLALHYIGLEWPTTPTSPSHGPETSEG